MEMEMTRRIARAAAVGVGMVVLAACPQSGASPSPAVARVKLGEDFRLAVKQIAVIDGEPLTVRFASVVADSRCPAGVQCVRAGEALVEVGIQQAGREPAVDTLATAPPRPQRATYGAYDVALVGLDPSPRRDVPTPAYVATLRVTRR
jgi:hypothetical protein